MLRKLAAWGIKTMRYKVSFYTRVFLHTSAYSPLNASLCSQPLSKTSKSLGRKHGYCGLYLRMLQVCLQQGIYIYIHTYVYVYVYDIRLVAVRGINLTLSVLCSSGFVYQNPRPLFTVDKYRMASFSSFVCLITCRMTSCLDVYDIVHCVYTCVAAFMYTYDVLVYRASLAVRVLLSL